MAESPVTLEDKYTRREGRIYLTGIQALVRLLLVQRRRDERAGLRTAGFVSGYRGSPLGGLDQQLWRAREHLSRHDVVFQPGINEDLAATAVAGTQQLGAFPGARVDGVYALWYGKAPGVDRSGDALRHGNAAGTSPRGGVLVVAGDDHACKSSTLPSQSEHTFVDLGIPVLNPSGVQEVLDYGLLGWALSRYSGCFVGLIALADTMDSSATVDGDEGRVHVELPADFERPPGGLHFRVGRAPLEQEDLLHRHRLYAALAFGRANHIDRVVLDSPRPRLGIVTSGKAHLDALQALRDLGLGPREAADLGIRIYKVGMSWPLEKQGVREFARGLEQILVVEEKRAVIENQLKEQLFNSPGRPRVVGKFDEDGEWLLPSMGDLSPGLVARAIASRLPPEQRGERVRARLAELEAGARALERAEHLLPRTPFYCSGCPHNVSTRLPEGSSGIAGIGCHYMVRWMDRDTELFSQMGGEGVHWIGQAPFTETRHVFANLGDGTYFHSGILAIRAAVAAGVDITFKILVNDAVAMTGGQKVEGRLGVDQLTRQLAAEGVSRIAVVAPDPTSYPADADFAPGTRFTRREELDALQRELRETPGCTALVYDQTCAAELRRRRKRGLAEDPDRRVVIHEEVCEGCGDCSEQSNCVSIEPLETPFGRKRRINQSSCNKDYSCLAGLCPALVTLRGARPRRASADAEVLAEALRDVPAPRRAELDEPWNGVVTGIGGTGVVTIGALLGMAAHLEGLGAAILDMTGLAQKGGAVLSHVRIGAHPESLHTPRVPTGSADLLLACDLIVAASSEAAAKLGAGRTHAVVNTHVAPTAEFLRDRDVDYDASRYLGLLHDAAARLDALDATELASRLLGDAIGANLLLLGAAFQRGLVPVSLESFEEAVRLNGVAVEANLRALAWGRLAAHDPERLRELAEGASRSPAGPAIQGLEALVAHRERHLTAYQDARLARRYRERVEAVRDAEARRTPGQRELTEAVARSYHRLLAPKDEYEVARLLAGPEFRERLEREFAGDLRLELHLAPPLWARRDPRTGRSRKRRHGAWVLPLLRGLARARRLRGTLLDPFRWSGERRLESELLERYEATLELLLEGLTPESHELAVEIAALPEAIRGFGAVKEAAARRAGEAERELLDRFRKTDARG